ncbi:MAG: CPBP family intramembrane metalloprotease [Deltaproteobacteria bacterium]|nr:CPBP family intramembrane metalloprotease [Deltaproteobacteria bacterium]MCB9785847.1 CPBP family intramembrane metalloprotease [Deltaproteobacteria bacterium]
MVARAGHAGGERDATAGRQTRASPPRFQWIRSYLRSSRRPEGAALAALPLLLIYGYGLLIASPAARSGVDGVSSALLGLFGVRVYITVLGALAATMLLAVGLRLRGRLGGHALLAAPMALESTLYGLFLGTVILDVMAWQGLMGPLLVDASFVEHVVMSAGAGLCEETVFRLLLLPGTALLLTRGLAMPRPLAWALAIAATSLAFAGAHHLGGEPWDRFAFIYRALAGVVFAALYLARGFGVAAWTHAVYDLYVLSGQT